VTGQSIDPTSWVKRDTIVLKHGLEIHKFGILRTQNGSQEGRDESIELMESESQGRKEGARITQIERREK
jgi:hypothetical protein